MKKKNLLYVILALVVVGGLIWFDAKNRAEAPELIQSPEATPETGDNGSADSSSVEGTLWASDNSARGNLMIVNGSTVVYINTSRDFSSLIGKEVVATIDGSLDNFTLVNIEAKVEKDGFIQAN